MTPRYNADKYIFTIQTRMDFKPDKEIERKRTVVKKESVEAKIVVWNVRAKNDAMWVGARKAMIRDCVTLTTTTSTICHNHTKMMII